MVRAHVFQEHFEDTTSFLIHRFGDPLHTATTGNTTDYLSLWLAESRVQGVRRMPKCALAW